MGFDLDTLQQDIEARNKTKTGIADTSLQNTEKEQSAFDGVVKQGTDFTFENILLEARESMSNYRMHAEFEKEAENF